MEYLCGAPRVPVVSDIRSDTNAGGNGWRSFATIDTTAAPVAMWPVAGEVLTFNGMFGSNKQAARIRQVQIMETRASGAAIKNDLRVLMYTNSAPTTPTPGAVYNEPTTQLLAAVDIAAADYKTVNSTEELATVTPDIWARSGEGSGASNIYVVVLMIGTPTVYAASADLSVRIFDELAAL